VGWDWVGNKEERGKERGEDEDEDEGDENIYEKNERENIF